MQSVPGGADYWDLGLQEGYARLFFFAETPDGEYEEEVVDLPLPEETMDDLESLLGDGQATITVGKEMKTSQDFETAGSSCYLKLTCNQDIQSVLAAREVATALALGFAEQGYEQARAALDRMLGRDAPAPPPVVIETTAAKEQDPEPGRKQASPRKKGTKRPVLKNRPAFRR